MKYSPLWYPPLDTTHYPFHFDMCVCLLSVVQLVYSERHFHRLERLQQKSFLLDFM
jgi:hypothetical protein